ncbi:MAG: hypothetical protein JW864_16640 [Spirochaetes bacterium]|nr:hypothetical protein [Spirochaetota bacterium]
MKFILSSVFFTFIFSSALFADEIFLKDGNVIKCEIIQITDDSVEYREIDSKRFLTVERNLVHKINYDDGSVKQLSQQSLSDKIYLKDGQVIEGRILKITSDVIIYNNLESDEKKALMRENVSKIELAPGSQTTVAAKQQETVSDSDEIIQIEQEPEPVFQTGGYIDSVFQISAVAYAGFMWGELETKEKSAYRRYKDQIVNYAVYPADYEVYRDHYSFQAGFSLSFMLPAEKYKRNSFGFIGIKYGFMGSYVYTEVEQEIEDVALSDDVLSGTLLRYRTINLGPLVELILGRPGALMSIVPRIYLSGGYIHQGTLYAVPALRDSGFSINKEDYRTEFTGFSGTLGAGIRFAFNRGVPIYFDLNMQYTYSQIKLDNSPGVYDSSDKNISFNDMMFGTAIGIYY